MAATIILSVLIASYAVFLVINEIKLNKKAKASGIPRSCSGCNALKTSSCNGKQCNAAVNAEKAVEAAKAVLEAKKAASASEK